MGPTGDAVNVIQIHPTLRCNLRCQHCYSTSGPERTGALEIGALLHFLTGARHEGFNAVGLSGGEPLMYRPLPHLLEAARGLGFVTTVTTNGIPLTQRWIGRLAPHVSLIAISLDGAPESHDRMRGQPGAFQKMRQRLADLRAADIAFGFIFTLTLSNLDELGWAAQFAADEGACLLQIHPLERAGRARDFDLRPPDDLELAYAFLEVVRLKERHPDLTFQLDVADRSLVAREPCRAFAISTPDPAAACALPLAALVSPLVVQEDGYVVPVQHGFSRDFAIGHVDGGDFRTQAARWKRDRYAAFLELARTVWSDIGPAPDHLPFTNWYNAITARSSAGFTPSVSPSSA